MCEPTTIMLATTALTVAIAAATSTAGVIEQKKVNKENVRAANEAYILDTVQVNRRIRQEQDAASQREQDAALKTAKAVGTAKAAAGSGNVKGASVQSLMSDYQRSLGVMRSRSNRQLLNTKADLQFGKVASDARRQSRINSQSNPSFLSAFGATAAAGASGISSLNSAGVFDAAPADPV